MLPFKEFRKQSFSHHLRNSCHTGGIPLDREGADSPRFWDKADRLMVVTVGGAALGGSIAGVYGAVIGPPVQSIVCINLTKTETEVLGALVFE